MSHKPRLPKPGDLSAREALAKVRTLYASGAFSCPCGRKRPPRMPYDRLV